MSKQATTQSSPSLTLMPEWAEQEAVILAWPHENTDWNAWLEEARHAYLAIISAINAAGACVILLCREKDIGLIKSLIHYQSNVLLVVADYNDTWARDYAFLTCETAHGNVPVSFTFNGWGQKFDASLDNKVNQSVLAGICQQPMKYFDCVLEGGALEIDQNHHLLSTSSCLYNPLRNSNVTEQDYLELFSQALGANQVSIFEDGHLEGDDTDGHIDTLVRFTPLRGLVVQGAFNRPQDGHFEGLYKLRLRCQAVFPDYKIFELPLPDIRNAQGERLPASYANFLICNDSVLFPIYQQVEDAQALEIIQKAFPNHRIKAIDCSTLVQQFGSLHCVTMQVPIATLKEHVIEQANSGVSVYAA